MIHGRFSKILISKTDDDENINNNSWFQVRYANDSLSRTFENIEVKYLTGSLASLGNLRGVEKVEGGISGIIADGRTEGLFLKSLFLSENVIPAGTKFKHSFSLNNDILATNITLDIIKDIQLEKRLIKEYRVSKMNFKIEPNSILVYDVEGKAKKQEIITNNITFSKYDMFVIPSWNVSIKIDGTTYKPKSIEFTYEEATDYDYRVGSRQPINITRGVVNSSVKVDFLLSSESILFRNKYDNDDVVSILIEATTNEGNKWEISIPKAQITGYSENSGDEILTNSIDFQVIVNEQNINETIVFSLINDIEQPY